MWFICEPISSRPAFLSSVPGLYLGGTSLCIQLAIFNSWTQPTSVYWPLTFEPRNSFSCMRGLCSSGCCFLSDFSSMMAHSGWSASVEQTFHLQGAPLAPRFMCCFIRMELVTKRKDFRCSGSSKVSCPPNPLLISVIFGSCSLTKNCSLFNSTFENNSIHQKWNMNGARL